MLSLSKHGVGFFSSLLDLVIAPGRRAVTVNPQSPNIPHARVK